MTIRLLVLLAVTACYRAASPPPRAADGPPAPPPRAPALESYALRADGMLVRLDLEHERMIPLFGTHAWYRHGRVSLAWRGGKLIACVGDAHGASALASIDLATREIKRSDHRCEAVTSDQARLLVLRDGAMVEEFAKLEGLREARQPDREHRIPFHDPRVIAANDRHVFAADDHHKLAAIDRAGEATLLGLELAEGPIHALAATRTRLYVAGPAGIRVFELATRELVRTLFAEEQLLALTQPRPAKPAPAPRTGR